MLDGFTWECFLGMVVSPAPLTSSDLRFASAAAVARAHSLDDLQWCNRFVSGMLLRAYKRNDLNALICACIVMHGIIGTGMASYCRRWFAMHYVSLYHRILPKFAETTSDPDDQKHIAAIWTKIMPAIAKFTPRKPTAAPKAVVRLRLRLKDLQPQGTTATGGAP